MMLGAAAPRGAAPHYGIQDVHEELRPSRSRQKHRRDDIDIDVGMFCSVINTGCTDIEYYRFQQYGAALDYAAAYYAKLLPPRSGNGEVAARTGAHTPTCSPLHAELSLQSRHVAQTECSMSVACLHFGPFHRGVRENPSRTCHTF
eukprot:6198851-Pleurochrysis_carterae.AAC.2